MADVELVINGTSYPVGEGDLLLKRVGNWTAYLSSIDIDFIPEGLCILRWLDTEFQAFVLRAGQSEDVVSAILVGGFGALEQIVSAQMFDFQFALSLPIDRTLTEIGLKLIPPRSAAQLLSSDNDSNLLNTTMSNWPRRASDLASSLDEICDSFNFQNKSNVIWRIQKDGTIFIGEDAWPQAETFPHEIIKLHPYLNSMLIAPESVGLFPGQTYKGPEENPFTAKVGAIHYIIRPDSSRAKVYFQNSDTAESSIQQGFVAKVREIMRGTEWHKIYAGNVIQQRGDGSLDVQLDNQDLPILTSVKLRVPVPGSKLVIKPSNRVAVIFIEGTSTIAEAWLWENGSAAKGVVRVGDHGIGGSLTMAGVQSGPLVALTFTYADPDGVPTILGVLTCTGAFVPNPASGGIAMFKTKATEGSDIFFLP